MDNKFVNDVMTKSGQEVYVNINISDDPNIREGLFETMLDEDLDNLSDTYLYEVVKESYKDILKGIIQRKDDKYLATFTKPRFITILTNVIGSVNIEQDERIACNKLAYDYCTIPYPDKYIRSLLFILSKTVNRYYIPGLLGIGINEHLASYLTLARFSSYNDMVNVKRLNFIIMTQSPELMTEKKIIDIYSKLFDSVTVLFEGVMFDALDIDEEWVTDDIELISSTINLALLDILHSLPTNDIVKVLDTYYTDNQLIYANKSKKFDIRNISEDYYKILNAISFLEQEGKKMPF